MNTHKKRMNKFFLRRKIYKYLGNLFIVGFVVFLVLLVNEVVIQPYRTQQSQSRTHALYPVTESASAKTQITASVTPVAKVSVSPTPTPVLQRDDKGRLAQFSALLDANSQVKGWLTIPDTNIDYVVMQASRKNPEYYLSHNMFGEYDVAGCIFIDKNSSFKKKFKNIVIHGHNMGSTKNMFHSLVNYKTLSFYKKRPVFTFDSIYDTGKWKIISVFITNGTSQNEPLFDYTKSSFASDSDFLNFVYQLKIRSVLKIDTVDVNEDDQILCLSTCSYELKNYRTVVVARKVRVGENTHVDVNKITMNPSPEYPASWYAQYGGNAPSLPSTFEEALEKNQTAWYNASDK